MNKYKFGLGIYSINIMIAAFCFSMLLFSIYFGMQLIFKIAFAISSMMILYGLVSMLFSYTVVDTSNLIQKAIGKTISISLNEVKYIVEQPIGKLAKNSIGVYDKTKKISITSWTKDYKELIGIILEKCSKNPDIKIDPRVLEIIKNPKM